MLSSRVLNWKFPNRIKSFLGTERRAQLNIILIHYSRVSLSRIAITMESRYFAPPSTHDIPVIRYSRVFFRRIRIAEKSVWFLGKSTRFFRRHTFDYLLYAALLGAILRSDVEEMENEVLFRSYFPMKIHFSHSIPWSSGIIRNSRFFEGTGFRRTRIIENLLRLGFFM